MNTKTAGRSRVAIAAVMMSGIAAMGLSTTSHAGCVPQVAPAPAQADTTAGAFIRTDYRYPARTIVGLWKFQMISKSTAAHKNAMPDGTLIDFGTAAWHGDGTEFQTSGIRNPGDGDVCQGVWQRIGDATFVLNHYALAWTDGSYTGPANIRAQVTVSPNGNSYSGWFETKVYLASAVTGHEFDQTTMLADITGSFTATRVTLQ